MSADIRRSSKTAPSYYVHISCDFTGCSVAHQLIVPRMIEANAKKHRMIWDPFMQAYIAPDAYTANSFIRLCARATGVKAEGVIE